MSLSPRLAHRRQWRLDDGRRCVPWLQLKLEQATLVDFQYQRYKSKDSKPRGHLKK
jgi:hypothetical protein